MNYSHRQLYPLSFWFLLFLFLLYQRTNILLLRQCVQNIVCPCILLPQYTPGQNCPGFAVPSFFPAHKMSLKSQNNFNEKTVSSVEGLQCEVYVEMKLCKFNFSFSFFFFVITQIRHLFFFNSFAFKDTKLCFSSNLSLYISNCS